MKLTEKTFELVKIMTAGGATIQQIAEHLGISQQSISRCRKAKDFKAYRELTTAEGRAADARRKAKKAPAPAPDPAPAQAPIRVIQSSTDLRVLDALREQNDLLKLISAKLAFIVDQLA